MQILLIPVLVILMLAYDYYQLKKEDNEDN